MSLPGVIVAGVVALVLMAVIRFGLGAKDGNRWTLAALLPGFLLGAVIEGGLPGAGEGLVSLVAVAAYVAALMLDAVEPPDMAGLVAGGAVALGGAVLLLGVPFMVGGVGRFLILWLPGVAAWILVCRRLAKTATDDGRAPLIGLTAAAAGLAWIAAILDQTGTARMASGLALVGFCGLLGQWVMSDLRVGAVVWLAGGSALTALALDLVGRVPAAAPAAAMLVLTLFTARSDSLIPLRNEAVRKALAPLIQLGLAVLPVLVAGLLAFVAAARGVS